ncbi:uncharacterized protein LOC129966353 [Argiope bruennichi]|uniref:uncharacterized protein LOC129966353 n=1 Tax=Argiope bruennichi TaxID=94029 RepID=UPI00249597D8|nr:uncharacterized protein LOC129966353 [Argiope bruennichi]
MGKRKSAPFSGQQNVSTFQTVPNFPTFFIIKRSSATNDTFHSVSPFLVERGITGNIGEVKSIKKLRSGDLLVEVQSRKQSVQIMKLKSLENIPVIVSPHSSLNSSRGVITCGELFNVPIEEITKELQGQGVSHVRRISIRRDGQLLNTKHLILTFNFSKLPEYIKAGYMRLLVLPYIPNPLRCYKCQRFGHSRTSCRGTLTCARCAETGHNSTECTSTEKCFNCKGAHSSFSRNCPAWQLEKEIISTKIKKQISYSEARKIVKSQTPVSGSSYSSVIKKQSATDLTQNNGNNILTDNTPESTVVTSLPVALNSKIVSQPTGHECKTSNVPSSEMPQDLHEFKTVTYKKKYDKMDEANSMLETMSTDKPNQNTDSEIESDNARVYNPHETIDETPPAPEHSTDSTTVDKPVFRLSLQKSMVEWVDPKKFYSQPSNTPIHKKYLKRHRLKRLQ